jgi:hypothetical protein
MLLQEAADAMDAGRRAPSPADPRSDPRRRPPRHFRKMVPGGLAANDSGVRATAAAA